MTASSDDIRAARVEALPLDVVGPDNMHPFTHQVTICHHRVIVPLGVTTGDNPLAAMDKRPIPTTQDTLPILQTDDPSHPEHPIQTLSLPNSRP